MDVTRKRFRVLRIIALAALGFFVAVNAYVYHKGSIYIISSIDKVPHAQTAIILGAAVTEGGAPTGVLQDRIDAAVALYKAGKVDKILMSGSNPTVDDNEVNPVKTILLQNNIPAEDIFLDHAGFDTYSTMYRAAEVFNVNSAIIVTQSFHLPRALYLARSLGIEAYGLSADEGSYLLKNYFREIFARPKALYDILTRRVPKYLGDQIPITGAGTD